MKQSTLKPWLVLLIAAAALFVWRTSQGLPPIVAAHFGAAGAANGFMTRQFYLWFMLAFVVLLPLALILALGCTLRSPRARLNLPNAEYGQAAEQRDAAMEIVLRYMRSFCALLVLFIAYVHWLVVGANASAPPVLEATRLSGALGVYVFALIAWIVLLRRSFRRPPRRPGPGQ